jgi:hypothetical protein
MLNKVKCFWLFKQSKAAINNVSQDKFRAINIIYVFDLFYIRIDFIYTT